MFTSRGARKVVELPYSAAPTHYFPALIQLPPLATSKSESQTHGRRHIPHITISPLTRGQPAFPPAVPNVRARTALEPKPLSSFATTLQNRTAEQKDRGERQKIKGQVGQELNLGLAADTTVFAAAYVTTTPPTLCIPLKLQQLSK
ncbi:hypothetical protein HDK64DRAFT_258808 [Phyllosticta capitalensis]